MRTKPFNVYLVVNTKDVWAVLKATALWDYIYLRSKCARQKKKKNSANIRIFFIIRMFYTMHTSSPDFIFSVPFPLPSCRNLLIGMKRLAEWFSRRGPQNSSNSILLEIQSWAPPRPTISETIWVGPAICVLTHSKWFWCRRTAGWVLQGF